ncbi:MAG TPA: heme-binding protein [Stellaceae bacterium]|nr:heme-binding protein [Stellaceae bacterium]
MHEIAKGLCGLALAALAVAPASAAGVVSEKNLSLDLAKAIAEGAIAACRQNGWHVTVTVLDRAAQVRAQLRDDGANLFTVENSYRKAYTARNFDMPSEDFAKSVPSNPVRQAQATLQGVIALGGGLPIRAGNETIGAIGVSGSPGKDAVCAQAGIDKVADELK